MFDMSEPGAIERCPWQWEHTQRDRERQR